MKSLKNIWKIKKIILFESFEKNKFIINVCCLQEHVDQRKAHNQLKFLIVKHTLNQIQTYFTKTEMNEIVSIKKLQFSL